jgi:hypothetical protein
MPKASIQYLIDSGFRAEQFGQGTPFDADSEYLLRVLAEAEALVRVNVGNAAYDAVTDAASLAYLRLRKAEQEAAKSELWGRRAAFLDGSAVSAMDKAAYQERTQYLRAADAAAATCSAWIDEFLAGGDSPGEAALTGLSVGTVVSGPWPQVAT